MMPTIRAQIFRRSLYVTHSAHDSGYLAGIKNRAFYLHYRPVRPCFYIMDFSPPSFNYILGHTTIPTPV